MFGCDACFDVFHAESESIGVDNRRYMRFEVENDDNDKLYWHTYSINQNLIIFLL